MEMKKHLHMVGFNKNQHWTPPPRNWVVGWNMVKGVILNHTDRVVDLFNGHLGSFSTPPLQRLGDPGTL